MQKTIQLERGYLDDTEKYNDSTLNRYKLFTAIWAIATLFHMANNRMFTTDLHYFLLTMASLFLLLKPSSVMRLIVFIGLQFYEVFNSLPVVSNHWIFATFVNLTILQAIVYLVVKHKSFNVQPAQLLKTFSPIVRIELIILYFFVVFHKLNSGFFNIDLSCASNFFVAQNAYSLLPSSPEILSLNAYLTIIIESLIPILLCFRLTRNWGLLIGLIFHCVIAFNPINGFYDFSSLIFATYFLFTSYRFSDIAYCVYKKFLQKKTLVTNFKPAFSWGKLLLVAAALGASLLVVHVLSAGFKDYFRHILWTAFSFTFIGIFIIAMFSKNINTTKKDVGFKVPHITFLFFPLIVFMNGITPYLGLKTEASYAMFSNLRTEGGISNHYLVPASVQLFDYQKDLIEIVDSSDRVFRKIAEEDQVMVYPHFKRLVRLRKPTFITYKQKGELKTFTLSEATAKHELLQPQPYWFRKLMRFRTIHKLDPQPCTH